MKRIIGLALLIALPAWAGDGGDDAFVAARAAFTKGDARRLATVADTLGDHPLVPWVEYFRLNLALGAGSDVGVAAFLEKNDGSYLAERMRADWLKWLARQGDWAGARVQFALLRRPDLEATCLGTDARLRLGETDALPDAVATLARSIPLPDACQALLGRLAADGRLPVDDVWARLRRQFMNGKLKEARVIAGWLPAAQAPAARTLEAIADHPAHFLAKLPPAFAANRRSREEAALAVLRMANSDIHVAAARWQDIEVRYPDAERGPVWGRLAQRAAYNLQPEASGWFERAVALGAPLDEQQQGWRVRAALRAGDWPGVARAIDALPDALAGQPEWLYWRARANAAAGDTTAAHALYERIAGQPSFYGILAGEALGRPATLPPRAAPPTAAELAAIAAQPGLRRGLALLRVGMRGEGVREWNWTLAGMNDRQLLAAAEFAQRDEAIDRAISAADRTRGEHDFGQRYPTPFLDLIAPRARAAALDPAWVFGLMRQESRFVMDAHSSVGAKGLMQLMPNTARWVAKKIGMTNYHPGRVVDMDTNVILGTSYMKMVLDSLDDHPLLASAAYNAGPGRARKWRAERPLEGAIYAETIPFDETRDYVKKVMANAIYYAALLTGSTPSLTRLLGTVQPRGFEDNRAEDLP